MPAAGTASAQRPRFSIYTGGRMYWRPVGGESQFYLDPETQASVGPRLLSGLDTVGAGCGVRGGDIRTRRSRPVKVQLERSASKGYPFRSECDWSSRCVCKNIGRFSL